MSNLDHIDFQSSFVLDWRMDGNDLVFEIEACLVPNHPNYMSPKPGEAMCWVTGKLVFESPIDIQGLKDTEQVSPTTDPDGSLDYGEIEALAINTRGDWIISGEFGDVIVTGSSLELHLEIENAEQGVALNR